MTIFAGLAALSVGLGMLGAFAARRSLKAATAVAGVMLGLIVTKVAAGYIPSAEPRLFPWDWYPFVERSWFILPAGFLIGAGLYVSRKSLLRRDVVMVLGGLLAVHTSVRAWHSPAGHEKLRGRADLRGICRQTSDYSCAPAAAVTFLNRYGVEATEREMAELCVTRSGLGGTTQAGLLRGIRRKLAGRRVRIVAPAYEDLPAPSLVSIAYNRWVAHAILIERVHADRVEVIDPLGGRRRTFPREYFKEYWQGSAIHVEGGP